jgi:hypothetical protein
MNALNKIWLIIKSTGFMAVLALISFCFAIYQTFYFEKKPEITLSVNALSRVFDVYQTVGKLKIIYANEDLRISKKQLWSMTVTVTNTGNAGIRKSDFDDEAPFGLHFFGAEIVDTPAIHASNTYLEQNIKLRVQRDRVIFAPSIIEPQDSIQISVLLLGPQESTPTISGSGKISGISKFVVATDGISGNKSTWEKVVGADSKLIQLYRVVVYPMLGLLVLVVSVLVLVMPFMLISELGARERKVERRKKAAKFLSSISEQETSKELRQEFEALSNLYIGSGEHTLAMLKGAVADEKKKMAILEKCGKDIEMPPLDDFIITSDNLHQWLKFDEFEKAGLVSYKEEGENLIPVYSPTLENSIDELARHLGLDLDELLKEERRQSKGPGFS